MKTLFLFLLSLCCSISLCGQNYSRDPLHNDNCQQRGCIYLGICEVSFLDANEKEMIIELPSNSKWIIAVEVRPLSYSHFVQEGRYVYLTVDNSNLDFINSWGIRTSISLVTNEIDYSLGSGYNYFYHLDCNVMLKRP